MRTDGVIEVCTVHSRACSLDWRVSKVETPRERSVTLLRGRALGDIVLEKHLRVPDEPALQARHRHDLGACRL